MSGTPGAEMAGGTGPGTIRMGTPTARWVVAATVLARAFGDGRASVWRTALLASQ